ncbi:hypothetical protein ABPG74_015169 [Tetrahymena malaccensis]
MNTSSPYFNCWISNRMSQLQINILKSNPQSFVPPGSRKSEKLIEIVLNPESQQYELQLNQDVVKKIETIDQSKKLSVLCFLGKAGQGKSTIANQMIKNISNIQEDVFQVGHSFKSQTQGADYFYQTGENENYLFIDLEGLFGQKSISKEPQLQVPYLLAIFNLQALIQIISTTSFLVKKYIRMQQRDIETVKIIKELIQQQLSLDEERPNWNNFFIFNQLNTIEKNIIDSKQFKDIGTIKNTYKENILGVSCNYDDDDYNEGDNNSRIEKGHQTNKEKFQKDILSIQEKAGQIIKCHDYRVNGRELAYKLQYLVNLSNKSIFSLGLFKDQANQMEMLIKLKSENDRILEEVQKKVEDGIIQQTKKFLTQEMFGLMINQVNKQKMNFVYQYYKCISDRIQQSDEEKMILKQINIRKKIVELYFSQNPNKEFQEKYNKIYNSFYLSDCADKSKIYENICPNYTYSEEYLALKKQKRGFGWEIDNQKSILENMKAYRFKVATAGLVGAVAGQLFSHYMLGKYKNNKMDMVKDGCIGLSVGGAFSVLTYAKPASAIGLATVLTVAQIVMTYNNPYRSNNLKKSATFKQITEMSITLAGYAGASYALGFIITNPIGLALALSALIGSCVVFLSHKWSQSNKKSQQKNILNYLFQQNLQVNQANINGYYQALQLKDNAFRNVVKNTEFLSKYLPANLIKDIKFHQKQINEKSQMQLYLVYVICMIGMDLDKGQQKKMQEEKFKQNNNIIKDLDAFTYYFDFDFINIGEKLYQVANMLKETYKITSDKIISKIEKIAHKNINGNDAESQQKLTTKQYLPYRSLLELAGLQELPENNIPISILNIQSKQKYDLWSTYICIQILKPSYALHSIMLKKLNFQLENEGIFFVDYIENFKGIFEDMSSEYIIN